MIQRIRTCLRTVLGRPAPSIPRATGRRVPPPLPTPRIPSPAPIDGHVVDLVRPYARRLRVVDAAPWQDPERALCRPYVIRFLEQQEARREQERVAAEQRAQFQRRHALLMAVRGIDVEPLRVYGTEAAR